MNIDRKTNEQLLRQRIAANMAHYRKLCNMTQSELAEKICYSDKSVSKWERAEGVPDIYILTLLADLFSVSVNDLISENAPLPPPAVTNINKKRVFILLLSVVLTWLVATVTYTVLRIVAPALPYTWYCYIAAIPVTCILAVIFTSLWWSLKARFFAVSALVWSIAASVYIVFPLANMPLIFAVGGVLQILFILWFVFQDQFKKIENDLFHYNKRRHK